MRTRSLVAIVAFVAVVVPALAASCTLDFNQFEPTRGSSAGGGASTSSGPGGSGGGGGMTASSSASSSSSVASSSSASSSSVASSSVASSSAASSTTSGATEDCLNNIDDDGDGDVDCADSDCGGGFTCVSNAPPAWNGPVALYDGVPGMKPAACPGEHPLKSYEGNHDLNDTPAICSACACSAPNVACNVKQLEFDTAGCNQQKGFATQPAPGQCGPISPPGGVTSYTAIAPDAFSAGGCAASGGTATLPPPDWGGAGLACAGGGLGGGCGNKAACAAVSGAPFEAGLCVYRSGDQPCPNGFGDKHLFVNSVIDTRGCGLCACGGASATCAAKTKVFSDGACGVPVAEVPNDGSCVDAAGGASIKVDVTKSGSCPASGGAPQGSLKEGSSMTTVCCAP
ncbi:MAG: hypothetical protein ABJE95_36840 [Byssovorax sp.]